MVFSNSFKNKERFDRPPHPDEGCSSCGKVVSKTIPTFAEPPALLDEILTSSSAERRHFRKNNRQCNSALAMASVRAEFVSRGPGISKYNPITTVHGRM